MTLWIVVYDVGGVGHVFTFRAAAFADAATITDAIVGALRTGGIVPEAVSVTGPYSRVRADGLPHRIGVSA